LDVARSFSGAIEQEHDLAQEQIGRCLLQKNYRPPRPIDVKGGCSPQNNRKKLSSLVSEVPPAGKQNLHKNVFLPLFTRLRKKHKPGELKNLR
jgi:hypothetical protein